MVDRVILVGFEGAQGLDVFGPAEVFAAVERQLGRRGYDVVLAAARGGAIRVASRIALTARPLAGLRPRPRDTVLVVGGDTRAIRAALATEALTRWLERAAPVVRRIGSVCSGAFLLARAGVLDGRRAATHWDACAQLAAFRPAVTVDRDAIFVRDGRVWTSAGVTTGIDMALAMVEEDHGRRVADAIAARFVLYARRPGFQSQFSDVLVAQASASDPLTPLLGWARTHLRDGLDVPRLARRAGLSVRTFHRRCVEELGVTPGRLVGRLRIEHARTLLATTGLGAKTVAQRCGFGSAAALARAFARELGVAPRQYRAMFAERGAG